MVKDLKCGDDIEKIFKIFTWLTGMKIEETQIYKDVQSMNFDLIMRCHYTEKYGCNYCKCNYYNNTEFIRIHQVCEHIHPLVNYFPSLGCNILKRDDVGRYCIYENIPSYSNVDTNKIMEINLEILKFNGFDVDFRYHSPSAIFLYLMERDFIKVDDYLQQILDKDEIHKQEIAELRHKHKCEMTELAESCEKKVETLNKLKGQFEDCLFEKNKEMMKQTNLLKYECARRSEVLNQLNEAELKIYELEKANNALKLKLKFILDMKDELK